MANVFITIKQIARTALPRLLENLVFPNLVHKDFSDEYANKLGDKIQVKKPVVLEAKDFDPVAGVTAQPVKEESIEVVLDKIATVDIEVSALEGALNFDDANRLFIQPAAVALAQKINKEGLGLYVDIPYISGTAGTTPSTLEALADVRKVLNANKVPVSPRSAVWDTEADAKFTTIPSIVNAEKSGSTQALREGSIGRIFGLDNYMSQVVRQHVTGITAGTALKVDGAVTAGATSLGVKGTTLTGKFVKGDVLTIAGKNYVVTEDSADAASNAIAGVEVYPALPALTSGADMALVANHTANLAFNPFAFAFITRPLVTPSGVESYVTSYNGISLRVTKGYDMKYKKEMMSMDVLYSYKTLYPEMAVRALG